MSLFVKDEVRLDNFCTGEDCLATLSCLEQLGKRVSREGTNRVVISGELTAEAAELDCGNSGTTARLLMGILAGQNGEWILRGDTSLSRRPMERVAEPLQLMGAEIELTDGHLPAKIRGASLQGISYNSLVASAQVKTALLLAAIRAKGTTRYREPKPTRDHTERILGIRADSRAWIELDPNSTKLNSTILSARVPSDPSSAAFWVVAAIMVPDSELRFPSVLINPLRIVYMASLRNNGADVSLSITRTRHAEEITKVQVRSSVVRPVTVNRDISAAVIDEIPVLAALATGIEGTSTFQDLQELRVKESDRLSAITENLRAMGGNIEEQEGGFRVVGPRKLHGAKIVTEGDHRIAMAFAIAGLVAEGETVIDHAECVSVSYPEFWDHFRTLAPNSIRIQE